MKLSKSVSLDRDVMLAIESIAKIQKKSFSKVINDLLRDQLKNSIAYTNENELITCNKCKAQYSRALEKCPNCNKEVGAI
jgi:metal-responsive CopG/Arc/MetJ family transcriptional regulator